MISQHNTDLARNLFRRMLLDLGGTLDEAVECRALYLRNHDFYHCTRCEKDLLADNFYLMHPGTCIEYLMLPCRACRALAQAETRRSARERWHAGQERKRAMAA